MWKEILEGEGLPVRLLPDADLRTPHALVVRQHQPTTMQTRIRARLGLATTRTGTLEPGTQGPAAPPTWRGLTELLRRVPAMSPGVASVLVAEPPEPGPEAKPRPL